MPEFKTKKTVAHSATNMFDLVADVKKYPEFVPLCHALTVRADKMMADGKRVLVADMTVAYKVFRETFTTKVTMDADNGEILVEYLDGPVSDLENRWSFHAVSDTSCEVGFFLAYEFKSRTFAALMGAMFDRAFRRFATAFEERADVVYGRNSA
ncbi:MAG: SRPBCC family protein [Pseudomonadota bacterium]